MSAHVPTQNTVQPPMAGTNAKATFVSGFCLPNSLLPFHLIMKLPTFTSEICSSPSGRDTYSHNTHTSHRNEPLTQTGPIINPLPHPHTWINAEMGMCSKSIRTPWGMSNWSWWKGDFSPLSGGKRVKMLSPQWYVTMVSTSYVEMIQENEANTERDTHTRDREEERLFKVLDPAVPEAQPSLYMGYDSQ